MNGPQDIGGAHGFGPVEPEANEPVFHTDWERQVFALTLAMGATGLWNLDRSRFMRESLPHAQYYASSYYEIWLAALERLIAETVRAETDSTVTGVECANVLHASEVRAALGRGSPSARDGPRPRFGVGEAVRAIPMRPAGHTRAPAYVRGCIGHIARVHGCHVFPDASAHCTGDDPKPLYNVAFRATDLWGADTTAADLRVDLFEPYLVPA